MGIELITGFAGKAHIRSLDMARFNAGVVGKGDYVFAGIGDGELKATMTTPNRVHIASGNGMMQGRHYTVDAAGVDLTVQTGTQGQKRNDLVVARYAKNASTGIETVSLAVLKGTPTAGAPADPAHVKGDILNGAAIATDMPLWRIPLNGITVGTPVKLCKAFTPCSDAWDSVSRDFLGLRFRSARNQRMPMGAGSGSWHINGWGAFADIPADRVQMVFVGLSACSVSASGVIANWNTWGGKNNVDIYTPTAQDVYVNIAVVWSA